MVSSLADYPKPGQTITAYVYLPSNSVSITASLFVMDNNYHWFSDVMIRLNPGVWNRITYPLSSDVNAPLRQLGVQFTTQVDAPMSGDVYIDAVSWS